MSNFDYEVYKAWILKRLDQVRDAVVSEDRDILEDLTFDSPAGDGWGMCNVVIDFSLKGLTPSTKYGDPEPVDISEAMFHLRRFKQGETNEED